MTEAPKQTAYLTKQLHQAAVHSPLTAPKQVRVDLHCHSALQDVRRMLAMRCHCVLEQQADLVLQEGWLLGYSCRMCWTQVGCSLIDVHDARASLIKTRKQQTCRVPALFQFQHPQCVYTCFVMHCGRHSHKTYLRQPLSCMWYIQEQMHFIRQGMRTVSQIWMLSS